MNNGTLEFTRAELEANVALDADIGSVDIGSINGHVDICSPVSILPFDIKTVIGFQRGSQGTIVTQGAFPLNRDVSVAGYSGGDAVVVVDLLRNGDLLVVSGSSELDAGLVQGVVDDDFLTVRRSGELDTGIVVGPVDDNIGLFISNVVSGVDRDAGAVHVKSLGGLDTADRKGFSGTGSQAKRKIDIRVVGIDLEFSTVTSLGINIGTGRNTPASNIGGGFSPDITWERGNVAGGSDCRFDTIAEVHISGRRDSFPVDSGVKSVNSVEVSVANRDL